MAKIRGPLFSMDASGSISNLVFDRRGHAYFKRQRQDAQTPAQGDVRQAMMVAQKCVSVCGETTRQQLKTKTDDPAHWNAYLTGKILGPKRSRFTAALAEYNSEGVMPGWETAAQSIGIEETVVPYANQDTISPGAQLFALATTRCLAWACTPAWASPTAMLKSGKVTSSCKKTE